jgi:cyclopropane-fatty-acyl-phospholipid synthase
MSLVEWAGAGHVRGITRSEEQLTVSRRRAADRGLSDRITFALEDYRATQGTFDRIVSVGMFEHVNVAAYDAYFNACRRLLKKDGIMLLHTLGRSGRPYPTNPLDRSLYLPRRTPPCVNRVGAGHRSRRAGDLGHRGAAPSLSLYSEGVARASWRIGRSQKRRFGSRTQWCFRSNYARRNDSVPLTRGYIAARENALNLMRRRGHATMNSADPLTDRESPSAVRASPAATLRRAGKLGRQLRPPGLAG